MKLNCCGLLLRIRSFFIDWEISWKCVAMACIKQVDSNKTTWALTNEIKKGCPKICNRYDYWLFFFRVNWIGHVWYDVSSMLQFLYLTSWHFSAYWTSFISSSHFTETQIQNRFRIKYTIFISKCGISKETLRFQRVIIKYTNSRHSQLMSCGISTSDIMEKLPLNIRKQARSSDAE